MNKIEKVIKSIAMHVKSGDYKKEEVIKNLFKVYKYASILKKEDEYWNSIAINELNLYLLSFTYDFAKIDSKYSKSMCNYLRSLFLSEINNSPSEIIKSGIIKLNEENNLNVFDISVVSETILINNTDTKNILLEKLLEIELLDNIFGIHRTGGFDPDIICNEGLLITSDSTHGIAIDENINEDLIDAISQNVTIFNHNIGSELTSILGGGSYKNIPGNNGSIMFIEIPKNLEHEKDLLKYKNSGYYLPTEFIAGYASVSYEGEFLGFTNNAVSLKNKAL